MNEKIFNETRLPGIIVKKASEAPPEVKANPFYCEEFWGNAKSPDNIYLPDSDLALSFGIAAHEIGHLVKKGAIDCNIDDFEANKAEEERAWNEGWKYIESGLYEFFSGDNEKIRQIKEMGKNIEKLMMETVDMSKPMYFEKNVNKIDDGKYDEILTKARNDLASTEIGEKIKENFQKIIKQKIGEKTDWPKFSEVIKKAVEKILIDNKSYLDGEFN